MIFIKRLMSTALLITATLACIIEPDRHDCAISDAGTGYGSLPAVNRIMVMGDSLLAFNYPTCQQAAVQIGSQLGEQVVYQATYGALISTVGSFGQTPIKDQFQTGEYDYVIINGGANDIQVNHNLNLCRCTEGIAENESEINTTCATAVLSEIASLLDQLIAEDVPSTTQIGLVGYQTHSSLDSEFAICFDEIGYLWRSFETLAAERPQVQFISLEGLNFPLAADGTHPTAAGSTEIADHIISAMNISAQ